MSAFDLWPDYWCPQHERFETVEQYASERTAAYLADHPEVIEEMFDKWPEKVETS